MSLFVLGIRKSSSVSGYTKFMNAVWELLIVTSILKQTINCLLTFRPTLSLSVSDYICKLYSGILEF